MIKYPVRAVESTSSISWWEVVGSDGSTICETQYQEYATSLSNALNAIHDFPPNKLMGYMINSEGNTWSKRLFLWYKKYLYGKPLDYQYSDMQIGGFAGNCSHCGTQQTFPAMGANACTMKGCLGVVIANLGVR